MIQKLVDFALRMPFIILATATCLVIAGLTAYSRLDIEAYPNPVPPLVEVITRFAKQKKATPAQIALAWLLAKKPWIVPIPGTTRLSRLEENLGGATIELTAEDVRELEEASSAINIEGERYPATHAKLIDR